MLLGGVGSRFFAFGGVRVVIVVEDSALRQIRPPDCGIESKSFSKHDEIGVVKF